MASIRAALSKSLTARLVGGIARTAMPRPAALALTSSFAPWNPAAVSGRRWQSSGDDAFRGGLEGRRTRRRQALTDNDKQLLPRTVHLDNLAWDLTDEDILEELRSFGEIEKWERFAHKRGTFRVQFKDVSAKEDAIAKLNGTRWLHRPVKASEALLPVGYKGRLPSNTIFIAGIDPQSTEEELNKLLGDLPGEHRLKLVKTERRDGTPGLIGFAGYRSVEEATKALAELESREPRVVRGYELYFKFGNQSYWMEEEAGRKPQYRNDEPQGSESGASAPAAEATPESEVTAEGEVQKP